MTQLVQAVWPLCVPKKPRGQVVHVLRALPYVPTAHGVAVVAVQL